MKSNSLQADEQAYLMSSLESEDIEMGDAESDDEDAVESALGDVTEESESEPEQEDDDEPGTSMPLGEKGDRNSQLAVGHGKKNNRTFVVRGEKIGVFKHTDEGKVEYAATIKDLGFKKMKGFKPKHVSFVEDTNYIRDSLTHDA